MRDFVASVILNLKGNFERQSRAYTNANQTFVNKSKQNLKSLNNSYVKHGEIVNGIGRKAGLLAVGVVGVQAAGVVMDFDAKLVRLKTDGRATEEQIARLKEKMTDLANDPGIRIDKNEIYTGFDTVLAETGDFDFAEKNLRNIAVAKQGMGATGDEVGALIAIAFKAGIKDTVGVMTFLSKVTEDSKTGSAKTSDTVRVGKAVFVPALAAHGETLETLADTSAVQQMVNAGTKSQDITAEAMSSLRDALQDVDKVKILAASGIQLKTADGKLRQLGELIPEIYAAANGDIGKLNKLGGESGGKVFSSYGLQTSKVLLQELRNVKGDPRIMESDARENAMTAKAGFQSIKNDASELSDWFISGVSKDLATDLDALRNTDKNGGLMKVMGTIATRPFTDEKNWPERQPEKLSGEIKITIDQDNRAKVKKVTSNNKDVNMSVDNGLQVGTQ